MKYCTHCHKPKPLNKDLLRITNIMKKNNLTIIDIAKKTGISKRTIYRWFDHINEIKYKIKPIYMNLFKILE